MVPGDYHEQATTELMINATRRTIFLLLLRILFTDTQDKSQR